MKQYDLSFYEKKRIKSAKDLKPKGYEKQVYYDTIFLRKLCSKEKILLDLGSGSGATINRLIKCFKKIIAVEKYTHFSKFINKKIKVINKDIREIKFSKKFDIVTAFGVFNHLDDDTLYMYKKVFNILNRNGVFIIKHGMGLKSDVILKTSNYWAIYRNRNKEIKFLKKAGFRRIKSYKIYRNIYKKEKINYYAIIGIK